MKYKVEVVQSHILCLSLKYDFFVLTECSNKTLNLLKFSFGNNKTYEKKNRNVQPQTQTLFDCTKKNKACVEIQSATKCLTIRLRGIDKFSSRGWGGCGWSNSTKIVFVPF